MHYERNPALTSITVALCGHELMISFGKLQRSQTYLPRNNGQKCGNPRKFVNLESEGTARTWNT